MIDQAEFARLQQQGFNRIPLVREVLADTETPLSSYLKLGAGRYSYFFESVQGGEKWGRFSVIGLPCRELIRVRGTQVSVERDGQVIQQQDCAQPFDFIEQFREKVRVAPVPGLPGFAGGLVGYFAYDSVRYVETRIGPAPGEEVIDTPDILLMVSDELLVFDNLRGTISFIINANPEQEGAFESAQQRLQELQQKLMAPVALPPLSAGKQGGQSALRFHFPEDDYKRAVERIKDYIVAGDVMQVVLAQRMSVEFDGEPLNVYRALRYLNPSPYMVYFDMGDHHVVSASPEILARVEEGQITVRPLAGTRKRGRTEAEDQALEKELLADEKEIAEHLMLIDLSRNDSGKVSKTGSVKVARQMFVERYSHVMHIASIVESKMLDECNALDVLQATLPVGTLSGAPKVRALEIIDELEPEKRGIYGGAMGYLGWNGNMDMAITIRTAVIKDKRLYVQAGAGIVADSVADSEWEETLNKARAILRALELSESGLVVDSE